MRCPATYGWIVANLRPRSRQSAHRGARPAADRARDRGLARLAPRRPEIEHDDVTGEVGELDRLAVHAREARTQAPACRRADRVRRGRASAARQLDGEIRRRGAAVNRHDDAIANAMRCEACADVGDVRDGCAVDGRDLVAGLHARARARRVGEHAGDTRRRRRERHAEPDRRDVGLEPCAVRVGWRGPPPPTLVRGRRRSSDRR